MARAGDMDPPALRKQVAILEAICRRDEVTLNALLEATVELRRANLALTAENAALRTRHSVSMVEQVRRTPRGRPRLLFDAERTTMSTEEPRPRDARGHATGAHGRDLECDRARALRATGRAHKSQTTLGSNGFVVLQDTLTRGEQTLADAGELEAVLDLRRRWQKVARSEMTREIEALTGRAVIGFMSDNHIDPDLAVEVRVEPLPRSGGERRPPDED